MSADGNATAPTIDDPRPPAFSDEALALRFAETYGANLRYVAMWSKWLVWDGMRWRVDETLHTFDLARQICRRASSECNKAKVSTAIASAKTVAAVERLAKADQRLAATTGQWDSDGWLLNTPGGIVDLRTGKCRPHDRADYATKITAVAPGGDCPRWLAVLERVTAGDKELIRFLQRMAGYCLTGSVSEHALFFGHGTGANGKGVVVNTISGVIGDYATVAPMETFIASNNNRHETELAHLRGARLVTAQETEEGRRWAENKIKSLTGGDKIAARFMRQDFFEFVPQFKLLIMGNHKPGLRGVDEAIRRRMNLIPFTVTIPVEERDDKLADKLKAEWPGILQWMIDGCLDWQGEGLAQPEAVRKATDDYLRAEDSYAEWIAECCTTNPNNTCASGALFKNWSDWANQAGEFVGSQKRFSQALEDRGFIKVRGNSGMLFRGISVIPKSTHWDDDGR